MRFLRRHVTVIEKYKLNCAATVKVLKKLECK